MAKMGRPTLAKIYGILDPDTNAIVYIGKANNVKTRWKSHLADVKRKKSDLYVWLRVKLSENKCIEVVELASAISDDWQSLEKAIIAQYRAEGSLLNMANGGNQPRININACKQNALNINHRRKSDSFFYRIWKMKKAMGSYLKSADKDSEHYKAIVAKLKYSAEKRPDLFGCWRAL